MPSRRELLLVLATTLATSWLPVHAQTADGEQRRRLFQRLRDAATEQQGRAAEDAIWRMWMDSAPSPEIARAVEAAMHARESYDFDGSLDDIEHALELESEHFAALAGKAIILMLQGRMKLGQQALRRAVEIHPWLRERTMLLPEPGEVAPSPGRDI